MHVYPASRRKHTLEIKTTNSSTSISSSDYIFSNTQHPSRSLTTRLNCRQSNNYNSIRPILQNHVIHRYRMVNVHPIANIIIQSRLYRSAGTFNQRQPTMRNGHILFCANICGQIARIMPKVDDQFKNIYVILCLKNNIDI